MLLSLRNQEKLERERGGCIITTHFGKGFVTNGRLNDKTKQLLSYLSQRDGWFAPVSSVLDFLTKTRDKKELSDQDLFKLEAKWF